MPDSETPQGWSYDFSKVLAWELDRLDGKPIPTPEGTTPVAGEAGQGAQMAQAVQVGETEQKQASDIPKDSDTARKAEPNIEKKNAQTEGARDKEGDERQCDSDVIARAHDKQLVGLAFSGGGIRSATFNLGVLQALARLKLLGKFNYLSTVSGGGYIGSWLMAWMKRRGVPDVRAQLRPERGRQAGGSEVSEIHFLRRFSNYLTPKLGWLGADMWTVIAVYVRNLVLNLIVLSSAFAGLLMLPRLVAFLSRFLSQLPSWLVAHGAPFRADELKLVGFVFLTVGAFGALIYAADRIVGSMRYFDVAAEKNAGREVIKDFELLKEGWRDKAGKSLPNAFGDADAGFSWHNQPLEDFVLDLHFQFTGDGFANIFVWTPVAPGGAEPKVGEAVTVRIAGPDQMGPPTAAINCQEPVRPAPIEPDWNELEITAVDSRCTVRVNGQTVNTARINLRGRIDKGDPLSGVLAIERQRVKFKKLIVTKIEPASVTGATQGDVQRRIVLPLFLAAFVATFLFGFGDQLMGSSVGDEGHVPMRHWLGLAPIGTPWPCWLCGLITGAFSALAVLGARIRWAYFHNRKKIFSETWAVLPAVFAIFIAAGFGGILAWWFFNVFTGCTMWEVLVWGPPALVAAFLAMTFLLLGLLGRLMRDERREWWSRLSAWLLIYSLGWIGLFGVAFYGPVLLRQIADWGRVALGTITASWLLSTLWGLIVARGAETGRERSSGVTDLVANVAPYVFVAGFVLLLSGGVDALLAHLSNQPHREGVGLVADQWRVLYDTDPIWLGGLIAFSALIAFGLSLCLDINQFSMHMLYRNRLGRCYLGASNRLRRAQPFTGFSPDDDLELAELAEPDALQFSGPHAAPYPIINAALNLVGGQELAWQQRKAASFVFTPFFCGYEFPELPPGYCRTAAFANKSIFSRDPTPITLATAMAISGAAASPNMGYHSSPAPAFLMTVFNVRLGWWLGNPRKKDGYERSGPLNVVGRLICELFGLTDEKGRYVYLSDGGHFENLGVYELVRRRCRFIVACDAEEDRTFGFGGLGNAIEKCRSDFGIDIDINVEAIRHRAEKGYSNCHCAIGQIRYSRVDRNARDGILVYVKSSLTGDEPTDVLRYAAANAGFPHQSTGDQWFDESQFESYRVLGFHIAENVFGALGDRVKLAKITTEDLFVELAETWHPPSSAPPDAFTRHTQTTVRIYDELRKNEHLSFLSAQIYPEWWVMKDSKNPPDTLRPLYEQMPGDEERKAGFYLCNSVLQLFEDAYVDLNLEDEYDHPDNRGWMNLFKHWSWAPMFRVTWTICASNYGARFQTFCERHVGLKIGRVKVPPVDFGKPVIQPDVNAPYAWDSEIDAISRRIEAAIWLWLLQLPVGSKMIADAALKANEEEPESKPPSEKKDMEEKALAEAKQLVGDSLAMTRSHVHVPKGSGRKDEEWFAAATLLELCRRTGVSVAKKKEWADTVVSFVLYYGAIIAKRFARPDFKNELNAIERDLIKFFFIYNPSLAASAEIRRLEVTPDPNDKTESKPTERNLHFPFGFVILAKTKRGDETTELTRLVYFRVQDHVRRMGLARNALAEMIRKDSALQPDLRKMHPEAHEVPTDKDQARFMRLWDSVSNTTQQGKTLPVVAST
jgi:hypothetical protein